MLKYVKNPERQTPNNGHKLNKNKYTLGGHVYEDGQTSKDNIGYCWGCPYFIIIYDPRK